MTEGKPRREQKELLNRLYQSLQSPAYRCETTPLIMLLCFTDLLEVQFRPKVVETLTELKRAIRQLSPLQIIMHFIDNILELDSKKCTFIDYLDFDNPDKQLLQQIAEIVFPVFTRDIDSYGTSIICCLRINFEHFSNLCPDFIKLNGMNLLHIAAILNEPDGVIKYIHKQRQYTTQHQTALMLAASRGNFESVKILQKYEKDLLDQNEQNAFSHCCHMFYRGKKDEQQLKCIQLLFDKENQQDIKIMELVYDCIKKDSRNINFLQQQEINQKQIIADEQQNNATVEQ